MTLQEQYQFHKETHKLLSEKYDNFNEKAFKLIPVLTFVLGVYGYLIKDWLLVEFKKHNEYFCLIVIMFLIVGFVVIDSFIILSFIYKVIKQRPLTIIKFEKEFISIVEKNNPEDVYRKLSEEYIDSSEKTYKVVTEKSELIDKVYRGMSLLIIASLVFFILYIAYNLIL